jgi:hypothetical protein
LEKPFTFDVIHPTPLTKTSGSGYIAVNQNYRESKLLLRYLLSGSYFHYAPDAFYKNKSTVVLRIREDDFRE